MTILFVLFALACIGYGVLRFVRSAAAYDDWIGRDESEGPR